MYTLPKTGIPATYYVPCNKCVESVPLSKGSNPEVQWHRAVRKDTTYRLEIGTRLTGAIWRIVTAQYMIGYWKSSGYFTMKRPKVIGN